MPQPRKRGGHGRLGSRDCREEMDEMWNETRQEDGSELSGLVDGSVRKQNGGI